MKLSEQQIVGLAALLFTVGALVVFFLAHLNQNPQPTVVATPTPSYSYCGQVVRANCEMAIKEKTPSCDRAKAEAHFSARLADPVQDESCQKAQNNLAESCPPMCVFDNATLVSVPGKAQFDFFPEPDAEGNAWLG